MPDITRTTIELVNRALGILRVVGSGQSPEAEDTESVTELVDPLLAQLAADEVCYIADPNAIPVELFLPLAQLLANVAADDFGQAYSEERKRVFESQLRRLTAGRPTYEVMRTDYF